MHRRKLVVPLALGLLGAGSAQGAALNGPNLDATVTAAVKPSSLPKRGSAPVTLSIQGGIDQTVDQPKEVKSVTVRLDPQLAVSGAALPTCKPSDVDGVPLALARHECRAALVGSGDVTLRYLLPGVSGLVPVDVRGSLLFFNGAASRLLTYLSLRDPVVGVPHTVTALGTAKRRVLEIPLLGLGMEGTTTDFRFRLGRTWGRHGKKVGYLSGRCATGTLRNRITLALIGGGTASSVLAQPCKGTPNAR